MGGSIIDHVSDGLGGGVGLDPTSLSRRECIDLLGEVERQKARLEAVQVRVLAELSVRCAVSDEQLDKQWLREEVACVLRVSSPTAAARLDLAREVTGRLPAALAALESGDVSAPMVRRLAETTSPFDDVTAGGVARRVLVRAAGQTFAQFAQALRRAVLAADARGQVQRHAVAVEGRRVCRRAAEDGMGELWSLLPADDVARCWHAVDTAAHRSALRAAHAAETDPHAAVDERTMDQRRAEAYVALLTGQPVDGAPEAVDRRPVGTGRAARRARRQRRAQRPGPAVHVTVALSTLLGLDEQPGELAGHGPVPAQLARRIAADPTGTWRRLGTDDYGGLLDFGRTRYRPPAVLVNHVRARDVTCRFPTCHRRAVLCELDHVWSWDHDGVTADHNLHPLCPRHHHLKHEAGWAVARVSDGTTMWIDPSGHGYQKPAEQLPRDGTADHFERAPGAPDARGDPPGSSVAG